MPFLHADVDWKAPSEDGQTIIWPAPVDLLARSRSNHLQLANDRTLLSGVAFSEIRRRMRNWLGHSHESVPLVATGHQTELYHPGVWIKNALINRMAQKLDGAAYHFAVDTDSPKHLQIKWPGATYLMTEDSSDSPAEWSGLMTPPSPGHVSDLETSLSAARSDWPFEPMLGRFLVSMKRLSMENGTLSSTVANALHELDWDLGLRHHTILASPIWHSEPFLLFVHQISANARQFAADYNKALADYRAKAGIKGNTRPMPDLSISNETIEIPFWLDFLSTGQRERGKLVQLNGCWSLDVGEGDPYQFKPNLNGWQAAEKLLWWMRKRNIRLAPRALTLTMFIRLFVADQFVHGIGGARYDQVTDRLIESHFGVNPPSFSVTTATLYFPGSAGRNRPCLPCLIEQGHRLKHALMGEKKMLKVQQLNSLPRHSPQRQQLFFDIHRELRDLRLDHPDLQRWQQQMEEAQARSRQDETYFDRELFYAIQPRERLQGLIDRIAEAFSGE